jgi:hypothetical protein
MAPEEMHNSAAFSAPPRNGVDVAFNGWNTGGTGGTIDFGWNSEAVLEAMTQQAKINLQATQAVKEVLGFHDTEASSAALAAGRSPVEPVKPFPGPPGLDQAQARAVPPPPRAEDVDRQLEAMVADLTGVDSFLGFDEEHADQGEDVSPLWQDAFYKINVAGQAVTHALSDTHMRHSAPSFVPGQMWTGQTRSNFVD